MTDYVINIGTKYDSTGMTQFARDQQSANNASKATTKDVNDQNAALRSNADAASSAADALNKYGMTAKAQAAAMRGVPAQVTDIVVSLQGGQAPLTVLLQQGGQLKDMFGGVVPAAQALASSIMGMVNPTTLAVAAIGAMGYALYKMGEDGRKADANIKAIQDSIATLSSSGAFARTEGQIRQFLSVVADLNDLKIGKLSEQFRNIDTTNTGLSASTGKVAANITLMAAQSEEAAKNYTTLLNATLSNVTASGDMLYQAGYITAEQKKQIEAAMQFGDTQSATAIVMEAMEKHSADQVVNQKATYAASMSVEQMQKKIEANEKSIIGLRNVGLGQSGAQITALENQNKRLLEQIELRKNIDGGQASTKAAAEANQAAARETYLTKQREDALARYGTTRQQREISLSRAKQTLDLELLAAKTDKERESIQGTYDITIKGINKQYDEKDKRANRSAESEARRLARELERQKERQEKYYADIADMKEKSEQSTGNIRQASSVLDSSASVSIAQRRIEVIDAESKAYERAGFIMSGYSGVLDGVNIASIEMSKSKAIEIGLIKKHTDEINEDSVAYKTAEKAARELAKVEIERAKAQQDFNNKEYTKQILEDIKGQQEALTAIRDVYSKGLVPGTTEWAAAMREATTSITLSQLAMQGLNEEQIAAISTQMQAYNVMKGQMDETEKFNTQMTDKIGGAFDALWDNGLTGLKNFLIKAAQEILKSYAIKMLMSYFGGGGFGGGGAYTGNGTGAGSIGGFGNNIGGFSAYQANGGAWSGGVQMFADGGIVNRATAFGMAGGATGIMGEAGPEAIMPLKRGPDGKLGVAGGSGGGNVNNTAINTSITINSSGDDGTDQAQIAKAIDTMVVTKVKEVLRDQQRTGNMLSNAGRQRY